MSNWILTAGIGMFATFIMTLSLYFFHWRGFANGDMVRALGSVVTRKYDNSFLPGLVIHFVSGTIFAIFYVYVWSQFPQIVSSGIEGHAVIGALCGFAQGLVISLSLIVCVAEHHPLEQFRDAGLRVALIHLVAHIAYGATVGVMAGALHVVV
jgi:hypothetical protein